MRSIRAVFPMVAMIPAMLAGAVSPAGAQDTPKPATTAPSPIPAKRWPRPGDVQKVFALQHVRADDMANLLSVFPVEISHIGRETSQLLAVSGAPAVVAAIDETIKRLDVPPRAVRSVDVKGYILECSAKSTEPGETPAELQDVILQLKRTLGYSACGLAETLFGRGADNSRIETWTNVGRPGSPERDRYSLEGLVQVSSADGTTVVRFRHLSFKHDGGNKGGINNDVDVRDGQRVVLGKLGSVEGGKDQILILTAKVVD